MPLYRIVTAVQFSPENLFSIEGTAGKNDNDAVRKKCEQC